jgi:predicted nucleic acid-binding OB-fold protein
MIPIIAAKLLKFFNFPIAARFHQLQTHSGIADKDMNRICFQ